MRRLYVSPGSKFLSREHAREIFAAAGWEQVSEIAGADAALAYDEAEVDAATPHVPLVVAHTYEPYFVPSRPLWSVANGARVRTHSPFTDGVEDAWSYFLRVRPMPYADPAKGRRKRMAVFASAKAEHHGQVEEELTSVRYGIAVEAQRRGIADIFGQGWGDVPTLGESRFPPGNDRVQIKHDALGRYAFNLCLENANAYNYVTEKLWEAIRAGCMPIYLGSSWLDAIFPSHAYLDLRDFASIDDLLRAVTTMRKRERVRRVRELQDALRDLEARSPRSSKRAINAWATTVAGELATEAEVVASPWLPDPPRACEVALRSAQERVGTDTARTRRAAHRAAARWGTAPQVFVSPSCGALSGQDAAVRLAAAGVQVVGSPEVADWVVGGHADDVPAFAGAVPHLLMYTRDPLATLTVPAYSEVDGTEVHSLSPWTGLVSQAGASMPAVGGAAMGHTPFAEDLSTAREAIERAASERGVNLGVGIALCVEVAYAHGVATERLWEAIRDGKLPIYLGSHWLDGLLAPGDYLDLRDHADANSLIDAVQALSADELAARVFRLQAALSEREAQPEAHPAEVIAAFIRAEEERCARAGTVWASDAPSARAAAFRERVLGA